MHVSPVPTRTSGRGGRRPALSVVAPIAALVLTVLFALAGRVLDGGHGPAAPGLDAAAGGSSPSPVRPARSSPSSRPTATAFLQDTPTTAYRLPVQGVPELLTEVRAGIAPGHLVAVSGSFTLDPRVADCPLRESLADNLCERQGLLASSVRPVLAVDDNGIQPEAIRLTVAFPSLAVRVPAGVALPTVVIWASAVPGVVEPVPVVVIGRLGDARDDCPPTSAACLPDLILERVAWSAGEWSDGIVVRSEAIGVDAVAQATRASKVIATREADRGEPILGRALLTVDDLHLVDAVAAGAIPDGVDGPVWYIRSVGRASKPGSRLVVAWAVVDERTGLVLASGTSASP